MIAQAASSTLCQRFAVTYCVGDVHGRRDLLEDLLTQCRADAAQRGCQRPLYVFLGDYIDRGPDSAGVIAFLREFDARNTVIALRGNHDQMLIETLLGDDDGRNWALNGMASTAISYGFGDMAAKPLPAEEKLAKMTAALRSDQRAVDDARWLASLPLTFADDHRIYVHAGLRPGIALADQRTDDLLWIREPFLRHPGPFEKLVVHGHTQAIDGRPEIRSNRIGLDTGAFSSGRLTAAIFDGGHAQPSGFLQT